MQDFVSPLLQKLERRDFLSLWEREAISGLNLVVRAYRAGETIVCRGELLTESVLLLEGFAGRVVGLKSGKRQITAVHLIGDFVDLHSFVLKRLDHCVEALTACRIAVVQHRDLETITEKFPHLTRMLWLSTVIDGAIHRAWLAAFVRPAITRTAHLVCELYLRLQVVGETKGNEFRLPLTQMEIGEILGLSSIHVNRVIQGLRKGGALTWEGQVVGISDWDQLSGIAQFDSTYLNLEQQKR
jgi:CRP-like cAMP-binding protein